MQKGGNGNGRGKFKRKRERWKRRERWTVHSKQKSKQRWQNEREGGKFAEIRFHDKSIEWMDEWTQNGKKVRRSPSDKKNAKKWMTPILAICNELWKCCCIQVLEKIKLILMNSVFPKHQASGWTRASSAAVLVVEASFCNFRMKFQLFRLKLTEIPLLQSYFA